MKADQNNIMRFLDGHNKNFVIPVYQRNYNWRREQCQRLLEDILDIIEYNYPSYFLGSIVSICDSRDYLIIDGQQRITSLSLLLLAMCHIIKDQNINTTLDEKIMDTCLMDKYAKKEDRIKLKPIIDDKKAYEALFTRENFIINSNMTINYNYFYNRLLEGDIDIDKLFNSFFKLEIVDIVLKQGVDNPQLIFESLNSTGLDLTEADRIRNFILLNESVESQQHLYQNYWYKIEKNTKYEVTSFIRNYLIIKKHSIPSKNKLYVILRQYMDKNNLSSSEILEDLLKYSNYYKTIIEAEYNYDDRIISNIGYINKLDVNVIYPFLMQLLDDYYLLNLLNRYELVEILKLLQNFIIRRSICKLVTNSLSRIFATLSFDAKNLMGNNITYVEAIKIVLINNVNQRKFPTDEEFTKALYTRNIYKSFVAKDYVFHMLETYNNLESIDVCERLELENRTLSYEHIMPQTLNEKWQKSLGPHYNDIHKKYLHTLGNLTLTSYNSKLSNKSFLEKRDMERGFAQSQLYLNQYLATLDKWQENEIRSRAKILIERCLNIWPYPKIDKKFKSYDNIYSLADYVEFNSCNIKYFIFNNKKTTVKNWTDFLLTLFNQLYQIEPIILNEIANGKRGNLSHKISTIKWPDSQKPHKISGEIFITGKNSVQTTLLTIRKVIYEYNIDFNDIEFCVTTRK
ncbi:hypothetical protein AN641_00945 [Candidatus Epulonipiscioides gigas]|nr:hypothetical protein AN641_00945 [Epulopiscium sp. SCG-C07WGA-EpuloA2]